MIFTINSNWKPSIQSQIKLDFLLNFKGKIFFFPFRLEQKLPPELYWQLWCVLEEMGPANFRQLCSARPSFQAPASIVNITIFYTASQINGWQKLCQKWWLSWLCPKMLAALGQGISGQLALNLPAVLFILLQQNRNLILPHVEG